MERALFQPFLGEKLFRAHAHLVVLSDFILLFFRNLDDGDFRDKKKGNRDCKNENEQRERD